MTMYVINDLSFFFYYSSKTQVGNKHSGTGDTGCGTFMKDRDSALLMRSGIPQIPSSSVARNWLCTPNQTVKCK